ncbi:hypothetical protein LCGC14_1858850 [marine sediment metagenome]|uniref:Uncharacterized protein n=1 Tax=marine sediment metagenome TaxID=412755 RepID=A0A0F9J764_9ZZZZ
MKELKKRKKRLSDPVKYLWSHFHYLKGGFTGWDKIKGSRNVHFNTTFQDKKIKRVVTYVEVITDYEIRVTIPPLSNDPLQHFKVYFGRDIPGDKRKELKEQLYPKIRKFILRNSL